jgi:hypothetical protein
MERATIVGQAIVDNARLIQSATMAATKSDANQRELPSLQLGPGTLFELEE